MKASILLFSIAVVAVGCNGRQQAQTNATIADASKTGSAVAKNAYVVTAVEAKLTAIDSDALGAVKVTADDGRVTLRGMAHSNDERRKYLAAARSVNGVEAVDDQLRVAGNFEGLRGKALDAALAAAVEASIAAQAGVNVVHVGVGVRQGGVTLRGSVPTEALRQTIVHAAQATHGVKQVVNDVEVHGTR